jgi:hypothetical protein
MRAAAIGLVIVLALAPGVAFAQAPPPGEQGAPPMPGGPGGPPPGGPGEAPPSAPSGPPPGAPPGAITRDQFVDQRAQAAGRLFDEIDRAHKGYITRAQLRSYIRAHRGGGPPPQQ